MSAASRRHAPLVAVLLGLAFLALLPQISLWVIRGREWNGSYVVMQGDEPLYSAYIRSLIDGQPRRNDPFSQTSNTEISETAFSVQAIPAYAIAIPARVLHVSAAWAMILLALLAAVAAGLAVFWLLRSVSGDDHLAAAGILFVLCFGGLAGGHGIAGIILKPDLSISALPFLRRYQPAAVFSLFFVFQVLVWRAVAATRGFRRRLYSIAAGLTLGLLIFSYFYLWTAAIAWLICFSVCWFYFRKEDRGKILAVAAAVLVSALPCLALYAHLISQRSGTLDQLQTVVHSHAIDLFRVPEALGLIIMAVVLITAFRHRRIASSDPRFLYALSAATTPLIVFNQQIVTGRMMQPFHYEAFVVNYLVLVALVVTLALSKTVSARALLWIAVLSFGWGLLDVGLVSKVVWVPQAAKADRIVPVFQELRRLSANGDSSAKIVFSPDLSVSVFLSTWTSQSTLLDMGGLDFGSISADEKRDYLYLHSYYCGTTVEEFRAALNAEPGTEGYARSVVFGHERVTRELGGVFKPIQSAEIDHEAENYRSFVDAFSVSELEQRPLSYAIVAGDMPFDFSRIDRWYERDQGRRFGDYVLYNLKPRSP